MSDPSVKAVIEAVELSRQVGSAPPALNRVSFAVNPGEVYCVLGNVGAGKTTLVDLVLGLRRPTSGRVQIAGCDPQTQPLEARRLISFVNRGGVVSDFMTPEQNVRFFAALATGRSVPRDDTRNALRRMGVPDRFFKVQVSKLVPEVGLAVALAIASVRATPALVLDEPTDGLGARGLEQLVDALNQFRRAGTAVLLTTADVMIASQVGDRVAFLRLGEKLAERTRRQVLGQHLTELFAEYADRSPILPRK